VELRLEVLAETGGWRVEVLDGRSMHPLLDSQGAAIVRHLVPLGRDPVYPQPAPGSLTAPDGDLATAADVSLIRQVHESVVAREPAAGDLRRFGRYLFDTLIGTAAWQAILQAAGSQPIELSLAWDPDQATLNRLPWELMHDGHRYLAQAPGVALLRRVRGAPQSVTTLLSPPRVLFVVGTELYKDVIEPGAEYLRLIQGLKAREMDLSLRTLLVLKCTSERLLAALEEFRPDVVHFICHGRLDEHGACYLELVDAKSSAKPAPLYSASLLEILKKSAIPAPIMVLSACYTATADFADVGQVAFPLATDLITNGIPIVVGMGGRIADQACRLFTRQFYESLLAGGDIAHATAEGRRAAISHGGTDPNLSVDWALPAIFFASGVTDTRLPIVLQTTEQEWQSFAREFRTENDAAFCDRLEIIEQFDLLMADEPAQRRVGGRDTDLQMLAVDVDKPDSSEKYGRTWLLRELAVKAVQDGHVPCLVCKGEAWRADQDPPGDVKGLLRAIQSAVQNTIYRFDLAGAVPASCPLVETLLDRSPGAPLPSWLPPEIHGIAGDETTREVRRKAVALRLDLLALLDAAAQKRPPGEGPRTKLVLLVDDLHRMGNLAVSDLVGQLCGTTGLRAARKRVRLVITYSSNPITAQELSVQSVIDSLRPWTKRVDLGRFKPTLEERQAYQHYLLHWRSGDRPRPLVPAAAGGDWLFAKLEKEVRGIPSELALKAPALIRALLDPPGDWPAILHDANDTAVLAQAREEPRIRLPGT
jgi:hypothetical protein